MMQLKQSEATAARRRVPLFCVDAVDGLSAETGEAGGQPQISKNGAAFANTSATLTTIGNGAYYVELTAGELDTAGLLVVRYKSAATAEAQTFCQVLPQLPEDVYSRLGAPAGASIAADLAALPDAGQVADAVWDEAVAEHQTAGTTGREVHLAKAALANRREHTIATGVDVIKDNDGTTTLLTLTPDESGGVVTVTPE